MAKQILLIDDDELLRRSLSFDLERAGYRVVTAECAEDGLILAGQEAPDLVLLDIGLGGMDGLEACRRFRSRFAAPIVFLTARRRPCEEITGLDLGAEDYITKPFDTDVLLARIKTVLRRAEALPLRLPGQALTVGDLCIDPATRTVTVAERSEIALTPREFNILYTLAGVPGQVVSLENLLTQVWGSHCAVEPQVIYVHVRSLREKVEDDPTAPRRLVTVHGVGYKLVAQRT